MINNDFDPELEARGGIPGRPGTGAPAPKTTNSGNKTLLLTIGGVIAAVALAIIIF